MAANKSTIEYTPGVISADELYTLSELKKRTRLGDWAIRQARKGGLRIRKIGNARFVLGHDFQTFVEEQGNDDPE